VKITGSVNNASNYKLMTASSFTGPFVLSPAIPGYSLQLQGAGNTELWLVFTDLYEAWSGIGANFDGDSNNDGVDNGMAWLLGAIDPNANASSLTPVVSQTSGGLVLEFTCLKAANRGASVLKLQYTGDLGSSDPWTGNEVLVPDTAATVGPVTFTVPSVNPDPHLVNLRATVPTSAAPPGTRLFARLKAER
jgi:hypothetical protein